MEHFRVNSGGFGGDPERLRRFGVLWGVLGTLRKIPRGLRDVVVGVSDGTMRSQERFRGFKGFQEV